MTKTLFAFICLLPTLFLMSVSEAQQATTAPVIGFLSASPASSISARIAALREGLKELGYTERRNIRIEYRYADNQRNRIAASAIELVGLNVEVIVSGGPTATRALKEATATIPIVMAQDLDPVASGFIASLARPGGNVTGLATLYPEITGKQIDLLREIVPRLSRLAVLGNSTTPGNAQALKEAALATAGLKVQMQYLDIPADMHRADEIEAAFAAATNGHTDAVLVLASPVANRHRKRILELVANHRLPATYSRSEFVENGGLMTYSVSTNDLFRRAATYVDKILKGAKPSALPVEQPTKFELVINLKAAKQISLTMPPNVLARADRVIR